MADLSNLSDEEQIEILKKWWKNNGISIVAGIILGVGGIAGWQWYADYKNQSQITASEGYEKALQDDSKVDAFIKNNDDSIYAVNLALVTAANLAAEKRYVDAIERLSWVVDNAKHESYRMLANINLAGVYIADNKAQQAIDILQKIEDYGSFDANASLVLGDAYLKVENRKEAKIAYQRALQGFKNQTYLQNIVKLKINDL